MARRASPACPRRTGSAAILTLGQVAQSVEQWTENPRVGGSIPPLATIHNQSLTQKFAAPLAPELGAGLPTGLPFGSRKQFASRIERAACLFRQHPSATWRNRRRALVVPPHPVLRLGRVTVTGGVTPADSRHGSARLPLSLQGAAPGTYAPLRLFLFSRVKPWKPSISPSVASPTRFAGK